LFPPVAFPETEGGPTQHTEKKQKHTLKKIVKENKENINKGKYYCTCLGREYQMIYRGPGFLAVIWFCSSPTTFSMPPVELTGGGGGGWVEPNQNNEKALSSINYLTLSVPRFVKTKPSSRNARMLAKTHSSFRMTAKLSQDLDHCRIQIESSAYLKHCLKYFH